MIVYQLKVGILVTLESVAIATTVTVSHRELRTDMARDSSPIRFRGSITQTSPRLPENMQRVSTTLTPSVRLKLISKTLPPLSQRRANVGISVNYNKLLNTSFTHISNLDPNHYF